MNGIWLTKPRSHADRMRYYRSEAARCRDMGAATSFTHAKQGFLKLAEEWDAMALRTTSDAAAQQFVEQLVGNRGRHAA